MRYAGSLTSLLEHQPRPEIPLLCPFPRINLAELRYSMMVSSATDASPCNRSRSAGDTFFLVILSIDLNIFHLVAKAAAVSPIYYLFRGGGIRVGGRRGTQNFAFFAERSETYERFIVASRALRYNRQTTRLSRLW